MYFRCWKLYTKIADTELLSQMRFGGSKGWVEKEPGPSRVPASIAGLTDMKNPVCMSDNYLTKSFPSLGLGEGPTNKEQNTSDAWDGESHC